MNNPSPEIMQGLIQNAWVTFWVDAVILLAVVTACLFVLYKTRKRSDGILKLILGGVIFLICAESVSSFVRLGSNPEAYVLKSIFKR